MQLLRAAVCSSRARVTRARRSRARLHARTNERTTNMIVVRCRVAGLYEPVDETLSPLSPFRSGVFHLVGSVSSQHVLSIEKIVL